LAANRSRGAHVCSVAFSVPNTVQISIIHLTVSAHQPALKTISTTHFNVTCTVYIHHTLISCASSALDSASVRNAFDLPLPLLSFVLFVGKPFQRVSGSGADFGVYQVQLGSSETGDWVAAGVEDSGPGFRSVISVSNSFSGPTLLSPYSSILMASRS